MANRILLGNHTNFGYGLFISKDGKDVTSNLGAQDLIFDSRVDHSSNILERVDFTISSGTKQGTGSFSRTLSYIPYILWCVTNGSGDYLEVPWESYSTEDKSPAFPPANWWDYNRDHTEYHVTANTTGIQAKTWTNTNVAATVNFSAWVYLLESS